MSEEYKKLSELPQAANPGRCEAYGIENGKSVRVPLTFANSADVKNEVAKETSRATQAEEVLQSTINSTNARTAHITQLASVLEADNINIKASSTIYIVDNGKAVLIFNNNGTGVGQMKQTLIKDGKVLFRENIKVGATTMDATYWSEWRELNQATNLNQISDAELKNYTEIGTYEGVLVGAISDLNNITNRVEKFFADLPMSGGAEPIPTGTLFTMDVLNNYAVVQQVEEWGFGVIPRSVTQRAKALLITGQYVEIQRTLQGDVWGGWKMINK